MWNIGKKSGTKSELNKISALIHSIEENPFQGIGKPEALKHELSGKWSRRINKKDRVVYQVTDFIEILSLRGHYSEK
ncbi:MAG: Txe/YoeB family addiction module toxin [Candidatus Azobacteroides sp.]|nr:Txe/YoeB family addiction module toxin [Candidatus Azobacteroides sp.]